MKHKNKILSNMDTNFLYNFILFFLIKTSNGFHNVLYLVLIESLSILQKGKYTT